MAAAGRPGPGHRRNGSAAYAAPGDHPRPGATPPESPRRRAAGDRRRRADLRRAGRWRNRARPVPARHSCRSPLHLGGDCDCEGLPAPSGSDSQRHRNGDWCCVPFAISLAAHESWRLPQRGTTLAALVYLIGLGSAAVFALFVFVVRRWPASAAAYQFVLFPIATVLLSSWLDHEAVTIALLAGGYSLLPACMSERWPAPPGSNRSSDVSLAQMVPGPPQLTPVPTRWKPSSRCHDGVTISGCLRRSGRGGRSHMQTDLSVPRRR